VRKQKAHKNVTVPEVDDIPINTRNILSGDGKSFLNEIWKSLMYLEQKDFWVMRINFRDILISISSFVAISNTVLVLGLNYDSFVKKETTTAELSCTYLTQLCKYDEG
jgi:hypothetical protein